MANGFEAFVDKPIEDPTKWSPYFYQDQVKQLQAVALDSPVSTEKENVFRLHVPRRLEIHHANGRGYTPFYKDKPVDVAWLETDGQPLHFNSDGVVLDPAHCVFAGYLANRRVSDMLPLNFLPDPSEPLALLMSIRLR